MKKAKSLIAFALAMIMGISTVSCGAPVREDETPLETIVVDLSSPSRQEKTTAETTTQAVTTTRVTTTTKAVTTTKVKTTTKAATTKTTASASWSNKECTYDFGIFTIILEDNMTVDANNHLYSSESDFEFCFSFTNDEEYTLNTFYNNCKASYYNVELLDSDENSFSCLLNMHEGDETLYCKIGLTENKGTFYTLIFTCSAKYQDHYEKLFDEWFKTVDFQDPEESEEAIGFIDAEINKFKQEVLELIKNLGATAAYEIVVKKLDDLSAKIDEYLGKFEDVNTLFAFISWGFEAYKDEKMDQLKDWLYEVFEEEGYTIYTR